MNRKQRQRKNVSKRGQFRSAGVAWLAVVVVAALVFAATGISGEMRTWTSASGSFSTEAELLEVTADGSVRLKRKDGREITVPLDKLSAADQEFARSQAPASPGGSGGSPSATTTPKSPEEVEAEASSCKTAKQAVLIYKFYLASPNLSVAQRTAATAKMKEWEAKAAEDQVRLGKNWMKKEEADKIREQAERKIEQAIEYLRLANGDLARKALEEASKLDPDSIQADFLMGVVYSAIANNDKKAQLHFEKCLKREPGNVSVLNNLAVTLVFQKKYGQAAQYWKTAATNSPKFKGLSQNIGSLITLSTTSQFKVPEKVLTDLASIYEELTTKHGMPRPSEVGFVLTPPYGSDWDRSKARKGGESEGQKESVIVGSGTGFVIAPQIIMTNHHVTENASGLLVLDPKNPRGEPLAAELIAEIEQPDLALIRCKTLTAPPVQLVDKLPGRGTDIMVLGYPLGPTFGTTLKSTRGAMVAMPDPALDNMFLYDALTNPGNSGGPLCDKCGRVAGVVRAVTGNVGGSYGAGIPIADALPFIQKHVPGFKITATDAKEVDWPAVDALVSQSTVLIMCKQDVQSDAGIGDSKRK
jgi:S1-C subfamily serine protease